MRKTFLLTSILLLSAGWTLAQYSSGSSATDQNTTGSQSSGADQMGAPPSSQSSSPDTSSDQNAPQSSGAESQGTTGQSMSSQQGETSSDMSSQGAAKTSTRTMTFEGCLSEANGKFHLTDKMGTSYELTGKTANLKSHVGHTIAVTGTASSTPGANQPGAMSGEQAGMEQTIQVSSFKHVSGKCKTSPSRSPGGSTGGGMY